MDKQEEQTKTGTPLFDGLNYALRMRLFLQAQGVDVWKEVVGIQQNIGDTWKEVF